VFFEHRNAGRIWIKTRMSTLGQITASWSTADVQQLAPLIRDSLAEMDRERRVRATLTRKLAETGIFVSAFRKCLGGAEANPATLLPTIEEISTLDGSVGWWTMISSIYGVFGGCLPADAAGEICGSDRSDAADRPTGDRLSVRAFRRAGAMAHPGARQVVTRYWTRLALDWS
jgi:hypothetical protein